MSESQTIAAQTTAPAAVSQRIWWQQRSTWVPLVFVLGNLAAALALESLGLLIRQTGGISWSDVTFAVPLGVGASQLFLAALWLSFGRGNPLIMWPAIFLLVALGCLARLGGAYLWGITWSNLGPLIAVNWPASYIVAIQFFVALPMVLLPLRFMSGWELDFESTLAASTRMRPLQFSLMQILGLMLSVSVSLALIRMVYLLHAETDRHDIFSGPLILFSLMWFSPTVIPLAATAWLALGRRRRWIGALVLALALITPGLIVELGLARYVDMHAKSLWMIHWTNLSGTLWMALNLWMLRCCGLKSISAKEPRGEPKAMVRVG